jgi:hypothetical protein
MVWVLPSTSLGLAQQRMLWSGIRHSTPEMGSSFWVELPVSLSAASARKRSHQLPGSKGARKRIQN